MKKVLICILILVSCFTFCGCDNSNSDSNNDDNKSVEDKINEVIEKDNYIIVDVRTKEEYDSGHIVGSINIPYDLIDLNVNLDKSKTIMVYCRSGNRSSVAYNSLIELGYDVLDLGAYDSINLEKE